MRLLIIVGLILGGFGHNYAQFRFKSKVNAVSEKGYYRIVLPPTVVSKCQEGLNDIRLKDSNGNVVPFFIDSPKATTSITQQFQSFPILQSSTSKIQSTWTIDQGEWKKNARLVIQMANADIAKRLKIYGSNEPKSNWYILKSHIEFNPFYLPGDSIKELDLVLPQTSYRYLQVVLEDSLTNKINIRGFGTYLYKDSISSPNQLEIPTPIIKDSIANQKSYLTITFAEAFQVDRILFELQSEYEYDREVVFERKIISAQGSYYQPIAYGHFSSFKKSNGFEFTGLKLVNARLVIENKDNPPLKIEKVKAWQQPIYVVATLQPEVTYELFFGNDTLPAPQFDLEKFKSKVVPNRIILETGNLEPIVTSKNDSTEKNTSSYSIYIWIGITAITLFVIYMIFRMVRDMKEEKS